MYSLLFLELEKYLDSQRKARAIQMNIEKKLIKLLSDYKRSSPGEA